MTGDRMEMLLRELEQARTPISVSGLAERTGLSAQAIAGMLGVARKEGRVQSEWQSCPNCGGAGGVRLWKPA